MKIVEIRRSPHHWEQGGEHALFTVRSHTATGWPGTDWEGGQQRAEPACREGVQVWNGRVGACVLPLLRVKIAA